MKGRGIEEEGGEENHRREAYILYKHIYICPARGEGGQGGGEGEEDAFDTDRSYPGNLGIF